MNTIQSAHTYSRLATPSRQWSAWKKRVLILGAGQLGVDVSKAISSKRTRFREVIGFLDRSLEQVGNGCAQSELIGTYDQLFEIVERSQVRTIIVCIENRRDTLPVQSLLDCKAMGIEVVDGLDFYERELGRLSINQLHPSALIFSSGFRRRASVMAFKRLSDFILAALGLVVLSPFFLLVGLLIKLDSPGAVFYRQRRVGLQGQTYMIWKFRSMSKDAELNGPQWADHHDTRISRVGRWLRKLRIDELPQFVNVLKGEMSLVGPRPERPIFVQELRSHIPYYDIRHTVSPGITGWAQTQFHYGSSADDAHVKLQYDLYYVKNMSLFLDAQIFIETIRVVLRGEGAR